MADRVEYEETALRTVDTAYQPPENQDLQEKNTPLVPFLYPSLLAGNDPLGGWQNHVRSRIPYHGRYMNLWLICQSIYTRIVPTLIRCCSRYPDYRPTRNTSSWVQPWN